MDRTAVRHALIEVARRRQRSGTGSALTFLKQRTARVRWPDLGTVLGDLPWAVAGAVATRLSMPERTTLDHDVLIAATDASTAYERLEQAGYTRMGS